MVTVAETSDLPILAYMSRFEQKNWASVVRLVVEFAGPVLTGPFSKLNDPKYLVSS